MRTYGRLPPNEQGYRAWVEVATDPNGSNDEVYITTLCQTLLLNYGESPFFGNYGIPGFAAVMTQIFPDYYVAQTQQQFAPFFASLLITKVNSPTPTYDIKLTTHAGVKMNASVPIPT